MKKYSTLYYFLFLLLTMGTFASIAGNAYGAKVCGLACIGFAIVFLLEVIALRKDETTIPTWLRYSEYTMMILVSLIFALRNVSIASVSTNSILLISVSVLLFLIIYHAVIEINSPTRVKREAISLGLYYGAVVSVILSLLVGAGLPVGGWLLTVIALLLLVALVVMLRFSGNQETPDANNTAWQSIRRYNIPVLILASGLLIGIFGLLTSSNVLPGFFRGDMPPGYQHLVQQGTIDGNAQPAETYKILHDAFWERKKAYNGDN
jgi:hypothetical protein